MKKLLVALTLLPISTVFAANLATNSEDLAQASNLLNQLQAQQQQAVNVSGGNQGIVSSVNNAPINYLNNSNPVLNPKEVKGTEMANEWVNRNDIPGRGDSGSVVYQFGASLPTVVCAPFYVCTIKLQKGEEVSKLDVADQVRWKITPSLVGSGDDQTTYLIVKPTDSNLATNLTVATDRRLYVIKLLSRINDWMPIVSFQYPEDQQRALEQYKEQLKAKKAATILDDGHDVSTLDFGFKLKGDEPSWKPLRVYTDGSKTYIQFAKSVSDANQELPALLSVGADNKEQLVNYRLIGDRFVVDSVISRAILVSGVGRKQVKVEIVRDQKAG
ncbi:P-type conjugative transfer protein TrbG (plasmid) [Acinetobacter sp. ESL0695]|uniref:P-type conjugative transfer protein TrbG n=1 Tax=Acinetobacter sp. ESL0695 TaxID=2983215 RepID=UPI0023F4EFE2|nr:P-type conjugative transfer protein TrbG [Acinetobacter sp. ESL0695]WEV50252.1 P-type conjugative transfer protein TrbG [Acinetobacter sp. ESL0695]